METRDIAYRADGEDLLGYLAVPAGGGRGPAVLVGHEGPGLTEHTKACTRRLAELGYVAFALDYHGGGAPIAMETAQARLRAWFADPAGIRIRAQAGLDVLIAQPDVDPGRVAAIGYCFGGATALELARTGADLKAVVGFHSGLKTGRPQDSANIKGKVLVLMGADDPLVPAEHRADFERDMTAAKVDWRMVVMGGVQHSFTNPDAAGLGIPGIAYDPAADRRSWRAMLDLFAETIGIP
ncbi:dienelactone hydrolase family protein [Phenylobacterium sp.]|uniref:dienelactone hydrolase family protein n=1 Tax=Phenylobacterium sp. TaxID=1871053 RepID=UPI002F3F1D70